MAKSGSKAAIASARAARKMERKRQDAAAASLIAPNGLKPGTHTCRGIVQRGRVVRAQY